MFLFKSKKKKIYIHIGHSKTGTSSLQNFFIKESQKESSNFLYPKTTMIGDGHHLLFKSNKEILHTLLEEINSSSKKNIIISSECGLPNLRHFIKKDDCKINFFSEISEKFDVKIIYYVRNHFEILESSFLQHTKTNNPNLYSTILKNDNNHLQQQQQILKNHFFPDNISNLLWVDFIPTRQFNYYANIEEFWSEIFSKKRIITKTYNKENLLNENIVDDFISIVDPSNKFLNNTKNNVSLDNMTDVYTHNKLGYLINEETRNNIKQVFSESNLLYAKNYLNKHNADLLLKGF